MQEKIEALQRKAASLVPDHKIIEVNVLHQYINASRIISGTHEEEHRVWSVQIRAETISRTWFVVYVIRQNLDDALDAAMRELEAQTPVPANV